MNTLTDPPDFEALFVAAPNPYLVLLPDERFTIVAVSDSYLAATMTRREEILYRPLFEVFPDNPNDPAVTGVAELRASLNRVLSEGSADVMGVQKYDIPRPDDREAAFEVKYWSPVNTPVLSERGEIRYIIHRVEDITEFMVSKDNYAATRIEAMEAEIRQRAKEVKEANGQLKRANESLRASEEQLRESDRQKDEFLAMLAHELRNPLSPISNAGELLSRTISKDGRARSAIEMIKRQATQLTRLVDDLLDVSRITQGKIQLDRHPVDLASIIAQAVESVGPQLRAKQHRLSTIAESHELHASGDHARLVQCVANVLTNAIKYTDPGGEIRIQSRAEGESAVIEITDTGIGISSKLLPRVFDLFVQSDRTLDRAQGGLGIGLAVVKRLVQMHGGEVSARSPGLGRGSSFEIRLPQIACPQPSNEEMTEVRSPARRVLIVDDNQDAANSLSALLRLQGHETQVAFSGREALERIESFHPEVALLDLGLPEMDGYALAERLRALPQLNGLRLVALTGYGQAEDRQRTHGAGFDDHLVKPVVLAALERILAGRPASARQN